MDFNKQFELIKSGANEIIPEEELIKKLKLSASTGKPLRVKAGFDPTAPDLHLGHTVLINKLKTFQQLGHQVIFLIGDFTGMIGDPTGKNQTRPPLTRAQVLENAQTYKEQIFKLLDEEKTQIVFNSKWMLPMSAQDLIKLCSHYTIARMLERNDFSKRYADNRPISIHEFIYPLIQGYDSVELQADIELGGTDQKFNLLVGRELQRDYKQSPQVIITLPLLEGVDGVEKMSKSLGNYIGVTEPAAVMFAKLMSIPDDLMIKYYRLLTGLTPDKINKIEQELAAGGLHPRQAKKDLALLIVTTYHSVQEAKAAEDEFERIHKLRQLPEDIPQISIKVEDDKNCIWIVTMLTKSGLAQSGSQARRLIKQGGVKLNQQKVSDANLELPLYKEYILQVGRRRFIKVKPVK